jgi:broad specificity phosphatase PhoE
MSTEQTGTLERMRRPVLAAMLAVATLWMLPADAQSQRTLLYFVRHSENQVRLVRTNAGISEPGTFREDCTSTRSCCVMPLSPLGLVRRDALTDWFIKQGRARRLTHLIATNKPRTVETLKGVAIASGLGADRDGDGTPDGTDIDLLPGDGIQQYPSDVLECAVGFERTLDSKPHIVEAIRSLPLGSRAVVANHSETLYAVIEEATGVDTSDPDLFPKETGSLSRVRNFNDLWLIELDGTGMGRLIQHVVFDLTLERQRPKSSERHDE